MQTIVLDSDHEAGTSGTRSCTSLDVEIIPISPAPLPIDPRCHDMNRTPCLCHHGIRLGLVHRKKGWATRRLEFVVLEKLFCWNSSLVLTRRYLMRPTRQSPWPRTTVTIGRDGRSAVGACKGRCSTVRLVMLAQDFNASCCMAPRSDDGGNTTEGRRWPCGMLGTRRYDAVSCCGLRGRESSAQIPVACKVCICHAVHTKCVRSSS